MNFTGLAYAADAFAQDGAGGVAGLFNFGNPMFLMVAMLAIFYFTLIRPQQKRAKEHKTDAGEPSEGRYDFHERRTTWEDNRS